MKRTIRRLNKALEDPSFRQGWISNITMCYLDAEARYREDLGKHYINEFDRRIISHAAARSFINILKG